MQMTNDEENVHFGHEGKVTYVPHSTSDRLLR